MTYSPGLKSRASCPELLEIVLQRSCWLTQSYCSSTVDDAPPTGFISGGDAQLGQPHPLDVDSCIRISVQRSVAAIAFPVALLEREVSIQRPTHMASLTGRRPPVDFHDGGTGVAGHPLKDSDELSESKVGGLSSPQALHPIEIEVFDADDGVLSNKLICQLEEPIAPTVADALADALQVTNRTPAVLTTFLTYF